jgi:hypothetical protein
LSDFFSNSYTKCRFFIFCFVLHLSNSQVLIAYGHLTRISERLAIRQERLENYAWLVRAGQIVAPGLDSGSSALQKQ